MNRKHQRILEAIFAIPVKASINWKDVESLFIALGASVEEGRGSRVRILLNEEEAVFHRPHPQKETDKGAVVSVRRFLENAGVKPC
jgi:HicA toxin of bacterial toxin-antitoxin,